MLVFGVIFFVTTILILFFKNENDTSTLCFLFKKSDSQQSGTNKYEENEIEDFAHEKLNLIKTYKTIIRIFTLIPIRKLTFILLTIKIAFTVNSVQFLKLIEGGVTKEIQTLMDIPLTVLSITWALIISKYTTGNKSLIYNLGTVFLK